MIRRGVLISLLGGMLACQSPNAGYTQLQGNAQGTTFRIAYDATHDYSLAVDSIFRVIDRSMSLWDSTSIISLLNANRADIRADAHFTRVFRKAWEVSAETDGYFDCTVGPLVKAWGFSYTKNQPEPDSSRIDSLMQRIGYPTVRLNEGKLLRENPRTEIDFNAIAQGYTVDVLADFFKTKGIRNYLIEVGGEVRAQGRNSRGQVWRVGIDQPMDNSSAGNRALQAVVPLNGQAIATSGSYRKFVEREGRRYSHAIDPHTGYPIPHSLLSISVLAEDCMTADAYATAFLVMGLEKAIPIAKEKGFALYGISAGPDRTLRVYQSPDFRAEVVE